MSLHDHLPILPIVVPLAAGAIMLVLEERRVALKAAISVATAIVLVIVGIALTSLAAGADVTVYRVGNWSAPYGIVLVVDRLSAVMVLLAAVLGVAALVFSLARWQRAGPRFHSIVQPGLVAAERIDGEVMPLTRLRRGLREQQPELVVAYESEVELAVGVRVLHAELAHPRLG